MLFAMSGKRIKKVLRIVEWQPKKRARNSTYHVSGTGIPCNDKRAHAPGREQSAYHLVAKNCQFPNVRLQAKASNILLRRIANLN